MKKIILYAVFLAFALMTAVSCYRYDMDFDNPPENYYLLTLENNSNTDIVWFVPYHTASAQDGKLPESLSGTDNCRFVTKAHERTSVNVTEDKSGRSSPIPRMPSYRSMCSMRPSLKMKSGRLSGKVESGWQSSV